MQEDKVHEGTIVDWRTYKLPGLFEAKGQAAAIEHIAGARWEGVIESCERLAEVGVANVARFEQYAHTVAQVLPEMSPFLRDLDADLKGVVRGCVARHYNQPR